MYPRGRGGARGSRGTPNSKPFPRDMFDLPPPPPPSMLEEDQFQNTRRKYSNIVSFGDAVITVVVGKGAEKRNFTIHESIATKFSDFFAAAVKDGWKESEERTVRLQDDLPSLFEIFQSFAYTGRIFSHQLDYASSEGKTGRCEEFTDLALLWVLGEELQSAPFKDAVVDAFIECLRAHETPPNWTYAVIYDGSARPSPMRRLHVDVAVWRWSTDDVKSAEISESNSDFFKDLAAEQHKFITDGRPANAPYMNDPGCSYHEHQGSGLPCYRTMFQ